MGGKSFELSRATEGGSGQRPGRVQPRGNPEEGPRRAGPQRPRKARVMVVDDEEVVRETAGLILPGLGYEVVCVGNGREAVELYEQRWSEIDLVIVDLAMPVMDGAECYRALRQINPAARVLLSTGYGPDGETRDLLRDGAAGLLQKPFTMRQLADRIEELLDRGEALSPG